MNRAAFRAPPVAVALKPTLRGVLWMLAASLFYSLIYIAVRKLTAEYPVTQVVLFRSLLGGAIMFCWLLPTGLRVLQTRRMGLYVIRVAIAYTGTLGWMYGIAWMPLADANALLFLMPLFTVIFAALLLRERVAPGHWVATAVGFLGALIIIRPGMVGLGLPALATLWAAASFSLALVMTKSLTRTENPNAIVFYLYALMVPFAAGPAALDWQPITASSLPWLAALGAMTVGAQQCSTRAFVAAPANVVVPIHYVQLPLIAVLAYLMFGQSVDLWTWIGAAVIIGSTCHVTRRSSRGKDDDRN